MAFCGDLREEGGDCNKYNGMPLHIIRTTSAASKAFTHNDVPYTLLHSLPIQNFHSTRVKISWFTKKTLVLLSALSLHTCWRFGVQYIWFHLYGYVKAQNYHVRSYEREPSHFSNVVAYPKNWHLACHELQTCRVTNFSWDNYYCRGISRCYSTIYCTFAWEWAWHSFSTR